jgi:dUTP pyrophosphatase
MNKNLLVKKLSNDATLPTRATKGSVGYDLYASQNTFVGPRGRAVIPTGLIICVPPRHYGRVAPRSGLAVKDGIDVGAGVIDPDYRGAVGVVLFNHSDTEFYVKKGDRIAQLILEKASTPDVIEINDLDQTQRGEGGFGSSGV